MVSASGRERGHAFIRAGKVGSRSGSEALGPPGAGGLRDRTLARCSSKSGRAADVLFGPGEQGGSVRWIGLARGGPRAGEDVKWRHAGLGGADVQAAGGECRRVPGGMVEWLRSARNFQRRRAAKHGWRAAARRVPRILCRRLPAWQHRRLISAFMPWCVEIAAAAAGPSPGHRPHHLPGGHPRGAPGPFREGLSDRRGRTTIPPAPVPMRVCVHATSIREASDSRPAHTGPDPSTAPPTSAFRRSPARRRPGARSRAR